jgi:hypothetical protein
MTGFDRGKEATEEGEGVRNEISSEDPVTFSLPFTGTGKRRYLG